MGLEYLTKHLHSPTLSLEELYSSQGGSSDTFPQKVTQHFSAIFEAPETFAKIPSLNISNSPESLENGSLVRFRAMVQDTSLSPEMYLSKLNSGRCGGWGIHDPSSSESETNDIDYDDLRECNVFWAVSVPGETEWYKSVHDKSVEEVSFTHSSLHSYKYPSPQVPHVGAQLKIYDTPENDALKAGEVADFVGILHSEPWHGENDIAHDQQKIVPSLHVLFFRRHDHTPPSVDVRPLSTSLRDELISWIADEALGGDTDAAEWALLAAVARVQSRARALHPPTLTISRFPLPEDPTLTPTLMHVFSMLFPLFTHIPLSLDLLNKTPFVPQSKQEDLHSGVLQLPSSSTILISEGGIHEGKLVEQGVLNVMAIQDVMSSQTLPYKFPFSDFTFPTDFSFLVLAEGSKSAFFKTDLTIPLRPSSTSDLYKPKSKISSPTQETLDAFRKLVVGAKACKIEVKEATSSFIQNDFVEDRKTDKSISPDDLKRSIMIARLSGLLLHERDLSIDMWKHAKDLERRRLARLHA